MRPIAIMETMPKRSRSCSIPARSATGNCWSSSSRSTIPAPSTARATTRRQLPFRDLLHQPGTEARREDTIADVDASGLWPGKVVTEVAPAGRFWQAEPEHQDYLERYPDGYTCHFIRPDWKLPRRRAGNSAPGGNGRVAWQRVPIFWCGPGKRGRRAYLRHSRRREPRRPGVAARARRSSSC